MRGIANTAISNPVWASLEGDIQPCGARLSLTSLIYIGGYGRSGSTLLESLLTIRPDVLACGEVVSCLRTRIDRGCTCGKSRTECRIWGPVYSRPGGPRGMAHAELTLALLKSASGEYDFVVDSSKTAWGALSAPFKLRSALGTRFHLVHIVRDPHGVCWSNAGGTQKRGKAKFPLLKHAKTSLGWWVANLSCEIFGRRYPEQYTQVRYDDLARSYKPVLERLFAALPAQSPPTSNRAASDNRHQLYGNHNRYKEFSPDSVHEDVRWRTKMPVVQKVLVGALTWPLRLRYGY